MNVLDRFLKYVSFDTQSSPTSATSPSTPGQSRLAAELAAELSQMGLQGAKVDEFGYVYAWLPASPGCEGVPCMGFIAHMDTSPAAPGNGVKPRVIRYEGGNLSLSPSVTMRVAEFENLSRYVGQELIVTDGTTLLGADDKAGVAEILTAMEYLTAHPEIRHGRLAVSFTPDEELGRGCEHFDLCGFGAAVAYTVDGGELGEVEYENFNAATADVVFHGLSVHPGSAKGKMKNAILFATEFNSLLPSDEIPSRTEGYEGFYHVDRIEGDVSAVTMHYIIRDHDRDRFENRKKTLADIAARLNEQYGSGTVELTVKDQYYNMKERLEPHMYLVHRAKAAFRNVGVEPREVPIRGGTDGARLSYLGLPCPNLSTGGFNFHGPMECIPVDSLRKMVEMLICLVQTEEY